MHLWNLEISMPVLTNILTSKYYTHSVLHRDFICAKPHNALPLQSNVWSTGERKNVFILIDLFKSVNQYLSNDQCRVIQNHAWVKDLFKVQDRPMDFNLTEYEKVSDKVSGSTLQLIFKKPLLVKLACQRISATIGKGLY